MQNPTRPTAAIAARVATLTLASLALVGVVFWGTLAPPTTTEACLVALSEADSILGASADRLEVAADALDPNDLESIHRADHEMNLLVQELGESDAYLDARAECRGESR